MERSRQGVTILPLSRLQQSAYDESINLTSPQVHLDAGKPASATLAIPAHSSGTKGKRGSRVITHCGALKAAYGDAHSPQRDGCFFPSRLVPSGPAFGVKPCVMFPRSEWHDRRARPFGLAAPGAASGGGGDRVSVQPFNNAVLECLDFGLIEQ